MKTKHAHTKHLEAAQDATSARQTALTEMSSATPDKPLTYERAAQLAAIAFTDPDGPSAEDVLNTGIDLGVVQGKVATADGGVTE
jgi:hypothetical protein